jgi:YjbE family integral membrane protein
MDFIISLLSIVMIDLFLAGDNAIVIGMAARNLPQHQQKKAIIGGTIGAIIIRAVSTILVVWLLSLTGLKLIGGLLLMYIAIKLLVEKKEEEAHINAGMSIWKAVGTIIIADMVMGLDNVLAVAGAANHNYTLVIVGLLISIPIMVYGSTLVIRLMDRFPKIIYLGAAILAYTSGKMITGESFIADVLGGGFLRYAIEVVVVAICLGVGYWLNKRQNNGKAVPAVKHGKADSHSASA